MRIILLFLLKPRFFRSLHSISYLISDECMGYW